MVRHTLFTFFAALFLCNGVALAQDDCSEQQKLTASDTTPGDDFAKSVSVSGNTAVIGAEGDEDGGFLSGSAYVFVRSGTTWTEQQKLTASDAAPSDVFGKSVSVSGDTAVIGAPGNDGGVMNSGSAYVFVRSGTTWTLQQKLTASDASGNDNFGVSVSVNGDTAVIGADADDDDGSLSGSAYVFVRSGTTWTEQQKLTASDAAPTGRFGRSVSVSGDTAVIGAERDAGSLAGSAYVFVRSGTTWTEQQELIANDAANADSFSSSVSVSGDTAVIGAPGHDDNGSFSGSAYVFVRSGTTWTEQQELIASDAAGGAAFGHSVSVSGERAVIGAPQHDSAYVFVRSGTTWTEQQKLTASDAVPSGLFGRPISLGGDTAVIGAERDFSSTGSAYVFDCSGGDGAVPASSRIGVMVLVLVLLGTGAYTLLRRRRSGA